MELLDLRVGVTFKTFEDAKVAVSNFCCKHYHPIRCDKKKSILSYNSAADGWKVTVLRYLRTTFSLTGMYRVMPKNRSIHPGRARAYKLG